MPNLWCNPNNVTKSKMAVYDRDLPPNYSLFYNTEPFLGDEEIILNYTGRTFPDVLPNNVRLPIIHVNLLNKIDCYFQEDEIQVIPISLRIKNNYNHEYRLLNILSTVSSIDYQKSEVEYIGKSNDILGFDELVLKKDFMKTIHLAREKDYLVGNPLVSDELSQYLLDLKVKGIWLADPEEYY